MFFADRNVEKFESSRECQPGGLLNDSRSAKRLEQAERADELLAFSREQRLEAVSISSTPVVKPLSVKLKRLSVEHIRSVSSQSALVEEGSASYESTSSIIEPCDGNSQSGKSRKVTYDEKPASATGLVDAVVRGTSRFNRKRKAHQSHSSEQSCGPEAAVSDCLNLEEHGDSDGETGKSTACLSCSSTESSILPSISKAVLSPFQHGNNPEATASLCRTSTDQDCTMMTPVSSNLNLTRAAEKGGDVELPGNRSGKDEDQDTSVTSVHCIRNASSTSTAVAESHDGSFVTNAGSLEAQQQENVMDDRASPGSRGEDSSWNQRGYDRQQCNFPHAMSGIHSGLSTNPAEQDTAGDYGKVRGRRGGPCAIRGTRGTRKHFGNPICDSLSTTPEQDTTGDYGKVRGGRGRRPYGSRGARGARYNSENPLHHNVLDRPSCDGAVNNMVPSGYVNSLSQYSAVSGSDINFTHLSSAGYTGETKHWFSQSSKYVRPSASEVSL